MEYHDLWKHQSSKMNARDIEVVSQLMRLR